MTFRLSKKKKILLNLNQIENLDMTSLPFKKLLNLFYILASNLNGINVDVKDIVLFFTI